LAVQDWALVVAVHAVDVAVAVVIDAVACDLAEIGPHVGGQIRVRDIHARVDHSDHDASAARGIPCQRGPDLLDVPEVSARLVVAARRREIGIVGRVVELG
jgi:hypothetical protein